MERVVVYIMSPFQCMERGNCFVITAMESFMKWPMAYALPDQEVETVADALVEVMFGRFGTAETIHIECLLLCVSMLIWRKHSCH